MQLLLKYSDHLYYLTFDYIIIFTFSVYFPLAILKFIFVNKLILIINLNRVRYVLR